jgi:small-conductance mechanosensitive channel
MAETITGTEGISDPLQSIDTGVIFLVILIILFSYFLSRLLAILLTKLSKMAGKHRIKVMVLIPIVKLSIYGIAVYYILIKILQFSGQHFLIAGGLFGAALGFGLKDLFSDFVGGIMIILENPFQVGDKIQMGEYYGEVNDIGLRATNLITPDDSFVSIPNGLIFGQSVASANKGASEMMVIIDLYIAGESDAGHAMKILREAVVSSKYVYISENRPVVLLNKAVPFYTRIRAKAYVNDLRDEFKFESDVSTRAWEEFRKNNLKSPELRLLEYSLEMKHHGLYQEKADKTQGLNYPKIPN